MFLDDTVKATKQYLNLFDMDLGGFNIVKPFVISAVTITNIVLNSIVIAVISRYPQLREDRTTLFMFSLTLSDLASGCTAMPISAAVCSKATPQVRNMNPYLPMIQYTFTTLSAFASLHSLCWVTVCKMVAITRPLRYEQLLTRNRCYVIIVFIWLAGAINAAWIQYLVVSFDFPACHAQLSYSSVNSTEIGVITVFIILCWALPVVSILCATAVICNAIIRAHIQITAQVNSIGGHCGPVSNIPSITLHTIRSGKNVLIICFVVLVLTTPICVPLVVVTMRKGNDLPDWYRFTATWIYMCNYSANSLLYITLFRSVRKKTKQMFLECWQKCTMR